MQMVNVTINDIPVSVPKGSTLLDAAKKVNVYIPTLCYCPDVGCGVPNKPASCRICLVEAEGIRRGRKVLVPACATPCSEGVKVWTNTARALKARRTVLELLLSDHPQNCLTCTRNQSCELQKLTAEFGIRDVPYKGIRNEIEPDTSSAAIYRDPEKCIMCRRCETVCNRVQTVGALTGMGRGFHAKVATASMIPLAESSCTSCGQCVNICPTGALTGVSSVDKVWAALHNPKKTVIVQTAPAVRVAIGQDFGFGSQAVTGKLVTALRKLGFDKVFDTDWSADLTVVEEAHELVERIKSGKNLPILTSCCPGWINFLEHHYPDLIDIPSSCKSPMMMFGAVAKTYYAEKEGLDPKDIVSVAIMPCQAKKYEAARPEFERNGIRDVDYVVTTRELISMLKLAGINLALLDDDNYDSPLGESSGASVIFGTTGGVLEAALRTVYLHLNGKNLEGDAINFRAVRGLDGVKEAIIEIAPGKIVRVAASSGLGNARKLLDMVRSDRNRFQAIEIMACPGGCINGGGQPFTHGDHSILERRAAALYADDAANIKRLSHENKAVKAFYDEFLGEVGGHKAHELLHTVYHEDNRL